MSWLIDGTDLSNLAFNIVDRSAGWKVPAKRGDNLVIPGRNGALWVPNKPFEVGSIVLSMWVVGANEDGTVASIGAAKQIRNNIDKLTALFAQSHKLLNVVQISSIAYGVKNFFTNPAFSGVATNGAPTYQNSIPNPAPRKRVTGNQLTNFYPNPSFKTVLPGADPTRINQAPTPHFGYGVGVVIPTGSATISTGPDVNFTNNALIITPNAVDNNSGAYVLGAPDGTMTRMGWNVGDTYTVTATVDVLNAQTGTLHANARSIAVGVNRSGVYTYNDFVSAQAANTAGTLKTLSVTFTIPNDATDVFVRLMNGSPNAVETLAWNNVLVEKASASLGYFDGDFTNTSDSIYSWIGAPGNSASSLVYARSKLLIPILYGNMQGGYEPTQRNWDQKIPTQIGLIINSGAEVFFAAELHEEDDMHKYFLNRLLLVDPDWALAEGDGGNQCLYRPSKWKVTNVINYPFKASRRMSVFTIQHLASGFVWNHIGNHFRADDNDGTSRDNERAGEAKELIAWIAANNPPNLTFSGDFNSKSTASGYPRNTFAAAGWKTLLERGPVVNGQYATRSGDINGGWIEDIYTKPDVGVQDSAEVFTNGSSDHFAWLKTTLVYNANVSLGFVKTYENVFLDPYSKRNRSNAVTTMSNYYAPSNYENYAVNDNIASDKWDDATNTNSSMQQTTAADKTANPTGGNRLFQVRLTGNVGSNGGLGTKKAFSFTSAGDKPLLRFRYRRYNNGTATRNLQVRLSTCKSDGTIGSSGTWQSFALPSGNVTWADAVYDSGTLASTSTYNYLLIQFRTGEAWVTGDGYMMDLGAVNTKVSKFRNSTGYWSDTAGPHFDGDSSWVDTYYSGSNANTQARWDAIFDPRWTVAAPTAASSAYYAYVQNPKQDVAGTTLSFHSMGFQTGGTQQFTAPCAAPNYIGQPYTLRFRAKGISGATFTAELLKQGTGQPSPVSVGSFSFTGNATPSNSNAGFTTLSGFSGYSGPSYTPVAGDQLFVRFTTPVTLSGSAVLQISELQVTNSLLTFSGESVGNQDVTYSWEAEKYNSRSLELRHKVKYVTTSRGHQTTNVARSDVPLMEIYCLADGDNPKITFEPQPLVPGTGYYFSVNTWGLLYTDATNLGNTVIQARVQLEFLDASNAVVATYTGAAVTTSSVAGANANVPFVSAPLAGIPGTATQVRANVAMVNSLKGTSLLFSKAMLLNTPVSSRHLGNLPYFDGNVAGTAYTWATAADDSNTTATANLLTRWSSANAGQVSPSSYVEFKGGPGTDSKPGMTISTTIDSGAAGRYLFGLIVVARNETGALNTYIAGTVALSIQFLSAGTVVNTFDVTTLPGLYDKFNYVQGMVNVSGAFDEVRYIYKSNVAAPVLTVQMDDVYLYADSTNIPVQHLNINKVFNPGFYNVATQWTKTGVISDMTAGGINAVGLSTDGTLTSNRFTVTPGVSLKFATWGRNGVFGQIKFYNGSNTLISTGTAQIITQEQYDNISASTFAVPAGAATAEVVYSSASGNSAELRYAYVGEDYATHEENGVYNPLDYPYFDGGGVDFYSSPTTWLGAQDDSASAVIPAIPVGWVYSTDPSAANVNVVTPAIKPPGSQGLTGGLVHAPKNTTRTFRTVGVFRTNNQYLSGQIALSALPGAVVSIALYQASSATATGTLMLQRNLTKNAGQVFVWNDLLISNDYVYIQITYSETQTSSGYRVWMDNFSLVMTPVPLAGNYPGYFDGNQGGGGWADADSPNNSVSIYYGGGRRAYAEVKDAIDMSSMAGGTRAEFTVSMEIPGSFWEDLVVSTLEIIVSNGQLLDGTEFNLDGLAGGTAPVDDAIVTITTTGTVSGLRIQDMATGGWIKVGTTLPTTTVIDNGNFTVLDGDDNSLIRYVTRGGSNQLLPVVPVSSVLPPRFKFSADATSTGSIFVTVTARRRYVIA